MPRSPAHSFRNQSSARGRSGSVGKEVEQSEVGRLREGELRAAAAVLGVQSVAILGYPDGGVDQVDPAIAMPALVQHIRRIRPHVVVTFGPEGAYGHPDHIAISQLTTAASMCAGRLRYGRGGRMRLRGDRKSTRLNSSHMS